VRSVRKIPVQIPPERSRHPDGRRRRQHSSLTGSGAAFDVTNRYINPNRKCTFSSPATMHRLLLALLVFELVGMGAELLLLRHTETVWELIPLLLIGWSMVTLAWHGISRGRGSIRALRATMGLFLIAGLAGFALHYQANMEFRLESNPSLSGWTLVWAVLSGKTPPVLAPGAMIQLGLLGLVYTYKHPALFLMDFEVENRSKE
jgi:hypothetical protein